MTEVYITVGVLIINTLLGACVWSLVDDENKSLLEWYRSAPPILAWMLQPLVLQLWLVSLVASVIGKI